MSDERSDALSEPRSEQAEVERTLGGQNHRTVAGLDDRPKVFVVARHISGCYGIGEVPAPNRQGAVTNAVCPSHGNDIDSDGACVTGPQPYSERENERFAGMLPVPSNCGLEPQRSVLAGRSSGGRVPRPPGRGGGHEYKLSTSQSRMSGTTVILHDFTVTLQSCGFDGLFG